MSSRTKVVVAEIGLFVAFVLFALANLVAPGSPHPGILTIVAAALGIWSLRLGLRANRTRVASK